MSQPTPHQYPTSLIWDPALLEYRFDAMHPMDPIRLELTALLCRELGLFEADNVTITPPYIPEDSELTAVHDPEYLTAVHRASDSARSATHFGLGTDDTPVFDQMHTGAARIAGGSLQLAEDLLNGTATRGVNFAGGMHHAGTAHAGGFCVYNDAALAIHRLLNPQHGQQAARRVVYIDVDAHHGDGTQEIFYSHPQVMTISLHQSGISLYPGTGFPNESGGPGAEGTSVNLALPEGTADAGFLRAFHATVPALVAAFEPDVIVSQHGCDTHMLDPLTGLALSVEVQTELVTAVGELADQHCAGRWIATGGGGYNIYNVVPRSWAQLSAVVIGHPIPPSKPVPETWRTYVQQTYDMEAPTTMGDDVAISFQSWDSGLDPESDLDRAVMATRREIFPQWGLDPWLD